MVLSRIRIIAMGVFFLTVYYKQVIKLRLVLANKTSLTIAIDWTENLELSQGVFQGYEFKYVDALSGTERGNLTVYGSKQERTIGNLTGYTQYNVSARALTLEGPGVWSHVFCNWTAEYGRYLFQFHLSWIVHSSSATLFRMAYICTPFGMFGALAGA